jgi:hypothetical protein
MSNFKKMKKCKCRKGERNIAIKINDPFELNLFTDCPNGWTRVNNDETKKPLEYPVWFVVCPTSTDERLQGSEACLVV